MNVTPMPPACIALPPVINTRLRPLTISINILMTTSLCLGTSMTAMAENTAHSSEPTTSTSPSATLDNITIIATTETNKDVASTEINSLDIQEQQINSQQDLVRYNPEISVAEVGRYGSKGFAIRGVDGNRVAINVDGMAIPDVEVNEIFKPYGYMNDSRTGSDVELMQSIHLKTGADGVASGSGSLGGAVNYQTKEPDDLLLGHQLTTPLGEVDIGGYAKIGFSSKNEEAMTAVGLAGANEQVEAMVNYVYREGHELKNHKMRAFNKDKLSIHHIFPEDEVHTKGIYPDPSHYVNEAILGKIYLKPTDEHKLGVSGSFEQRENQNYAITKATFSGQRRLAWDKNQRESYGVSYQYTPNDSPFIDNIKADYQHQSVMNLGDTFTYFEKFSEPNQYNLAFNEYRPIYQDTDQYTLKLTSQPQSLSALPVTKNSQHTFSTVLNYAKQNYDPYKITRNIDNQTIIGEYNTISSPDMDTDKYSIALADNIQLNDKARIAVGVRYDSYTRQPYFHPQKALAVDAMGDGAMLKVLYKNGDFDQDTTFDNVGWSALTEYQLNDQWQAQYKASTGFLVPTITQMYSAFSMLGNHQKPNLNLQPETSLNHELAFTGQFDHGAMRLRGFYSRYDNFIDTINYDNPSFNNGLPAGNIIESINVDSANTKGIGIGGDLYLDTLFDTEDSITLTGQLNYATDSTSKGTNLLATQPLTGIIGLDYLSADDTYSLHSKLSYIGKKKTEDAKKLQYDFTNDSYYVDSFIKTEGLEDKLSSALLLDVYGSIKLGEGVRLNAGVYNLLNEKYIPWDNIRPLATIGINNMVEDNGIWRYSAPGTNYGVSLTVEY